MDLSTVSLILGALGTIVAVGNQIVQVVEKRRRGTVDEGRLGLEGLRTLAEQQREELDDMRERRTEDRDRIAGLEERVDHLTRELRNTKAELRKAHDDIDRLTLLLDMKKA